MSDNTGTSPQRKPNYRMTLMRRQAWGTLAYGGDLVTVSTTGLWEAARKALKEGRAHLLASAFEELFNRCEQDHEGPVVRLRVGIEYPKAVSDTATPDAEVADPPEPSVSDTPGPDTDLPTLGEADVSDTPHPDPAALVRTLRESGQSYRAIAEALNAQGIPTLTGRGKWYASTARALLA